MLDARIVERVTAAVPTATSALARSARSRSWPFYWWLPCNRPIDQLVIAAGLSIDRLDRFDLPNTPRYLGVHYRGAATVA